jgi:hypothetical protein
VLARPLARTAALCGAARCCASRCWLASRFALEAPLHKLHAVCGQPEGACISPSPSPTLRPPPPLLQLKQPNRSLHINQLQSIPPELGNLDLEALSLHSNCLTSLPPDLGRWTRCERLSL